MNYDMIHGILNSLKYTKILNKMHKLEICTAKNMKRTFKNCIF